MFQRMLPVLALMSFTFPAFAEDKLPCEVTPDETSCSLNFACLGDSGRWYQGLAIGRGTGVLDGKTSDGAACTGTWTNSNSKGLGQADFSCDDGTVGSVFYFLQDGYTGTAIGHGSTNNGDRIQAWSGEHVLEFFRNGDPKAQSTLKCGGKEFLLS